jgi:hypothetical protein
MRIIIKAYVLQQRRPDDASSRVSNLLVQWLKLG